MNESRHPIDDLFRKGLDQFSVDAPMHVWERIDQKRTPVYKLANNFKQNRRWYLSVASGLILMSSAAMFFLNGDLSSEKLSLLGTTDTEIQQGDANAQNAHTGNKNTGKGNSASPEGILTAPANEHAMEGTSGSYVPDQPQQAAPQQSFRGEEPVRQPRVEKTAPVAQVPVKEERTDEVVEVPHYDLPVVKEVNNDENRNNGAVTPYTPGNRNTLPEEDKEEKPPVETPGPVADNTDKKEGGQNNDNAALPLVPSRWSIEFLGSYDIVNRKIQHPDADFVRIRTNAEKVDNGFTLQLRGQYRLNKNSNVLSLRSGISFTRISESLNYNQPVNYQEIENRQVTGYIMDPINGPQQIIYTVRDTVTKTRFTPVTSRNTYTFIDVPVLLNYTWLSGDKFSFSASGGPLFNVAFLQKGKILGPVNSEVIDLNGANNPFRTYAGVNLMLNLGVSYHINRNFDLLFEPGARLGMGSLTSKGMDMTQRYSTINLFTGVRYKF